MEPTGVLEKEPNTPDINNSENKEVPKYEPFLPQEWKQEKTPVTSALTEDVQISSLEEIKSELASNDQDYSQQKIEIKDLHNFQTEPKNLKYSVIDTVSDVKVESAKALDFETHPNPVDGKRLEELVKIQNPLLFKLKVFQIVGGNMILQKLNNEGAPTGLSHGTMDYIYRIGVGPKVDGFLDNLALAVGCLQRRCQITDIMEKIINKDSCSQVISLAGGTCILPLEAAYQSKKDSLHIINMDFSDRAQQKASSTLKSLEDQAGYRNISLEYKNADLLSDKIPPKEKDIKEVVECTGFWEYLNTEDRDRLLGNVYERIGQDDTFVLTALVNNPQRDIFGAIKFKELRPHPLEELVGQVENKFKVERAVLTPNGTYVTLVLKKKTDL